MLLNLKTTTVEAPVKLKVVTVNPGKRVIAGYVNVPSTGTPDTIQVTAYFSTISGQYLTDMNI